MDVLFHVVDDDRYGRAIANLHSLLRPGGVLILTENLLHGDWHRGEHQVSRDADWILGLLRQTGFDVLSAPAAVRADEHPGRLATAACSRAGGGR